MINLINDGLISSFVTFDKDSKELHFNKLYTKLSGITKLKLDAKLIEKFKLEGMKYYLKADLKEL